MDSQKVIAWVTPDNEGDQEALLGNSHLEEWEVTPQELDAKLNTFNTEDTPFVAGLLLEYKLSLIGSYITGEAPSHPESDSAARSLFYLQ